MRQIVENAASCNVKESIKFIYWSQVRMTSRQAREREKRQENITSLVEISTA